MVALRRSAGPARSIAGSLIFSLIYHLSSWTGLVWIVGVSVHAVALLVMCVYVRSSRQGVEPGV